MSHFNLTSKTPVPGIPSVSTTTLLSVAQALKQVVETREGLRGNVMDKAVTFRDLFDIGFLEVRDHTGEIFFKQLDSAQTFMPHIENLGLVPADMAAHIAATDPHTQYQLEAQKGVAGGYASLGLDAFVPDTQLSPTIARDTEVAAAIAAHEAAADPHPQYLNRARLITDPVLMLLMAGA